MPLPLLIPLGIAAAGALGLGKSVKAAADTSDAKDINSRAKRIANYAQEDLDTAKENLNKILESYGEKKLTVIDSHLRKFIDTFGQIKNVEFASGENIDDLSKVSMTKEELKEISDTVSIVKETVSGGIAGLGGGALAAFGAYNGTLLLASAGTGTAIGTLSGVAATNATLAWLGGGTLASGGLGIAGGTMVLGVLAAGPALLIFGSILGANAKKSLYDAQSNLEEAKTIEAELSVVTEKLNQIHEAVNICLKVLDKFSGKMRRANKKLVTLISESGFDYSQYSEDDKKSVFASVKIAQVLKMIIDLPLLNEDGELIKISIEKISDIYL
ncbi:MAG: hypothetical protein B6229_03740 [Spirochaetaceae bacterium 4572_7]|nr:MAG: hypothetical protein B6229_03740 [Spirochaetaceae bacterium 4572_7]